MVVMLVAVSLLISANSVLAARYCDDCGAFVDGYYECYRRSAYTEYCKIQSCPGQCWYCYTDWCCVNGHGTWLDNTHEHAFIYHTCGVTNGVVCIY